jgi:hypothetical protein
MTLAPGANVIKRFMSVIFQFTYKATVFVSCKPFKLSLMFVEKAGAYPCGAPKISSPIG